MAIAYDTSFSQQEQASFDVDALVNDNETESMRHAPITPLTAHFLEQPRRATPTIPPGFTAPAVPRAVAEESTSRPNSRPMSRTTSATITPAVPVVPVTPIRTTTPSKAKKSKQPVDVTPIATVSTKAHPETPTKTVSKTTTTKQSTKTEPRPDSKLDTVAQTDQKENNDTKPTPNEPSVKTPGKAKGAASKNAPVIESSAQRKSTKGSNGELKKVDVDIANNVTPTKRQPPGKLDITAATRGPEAEQSPGTASQKEDNQSKNARARPTSVPSVPPSPAVAGTGSPIKRTVAPRTLRVVPTPKTENPPAITSATAQTLPQVPTVDKLRSRQASIASVNMPGTPLSEMISDTASVTSASYSRANSPPPVGGKVGTAPVRKKTKSQAKKDRQERKRQIEEELAVEENKSDVEVVQAPIVGRKKKTKKPSSNPKPTPAAAKSQPASPKPATVEDEQSDAPLSASKPDQSAKSSARATPDLDQAQDAKDKREHSAQAILADLQRTGELITSTLEFFKPLSSSLTHPSRTSAANLTSGPPDLKIHFSEADLDALAKKKPVRVQSQDNKPDSRTLITPSGKFFWGLSAELEEKALELEKRIEEVTSQARFHARKPSNQSFTAAKGQPKDVLPTIATALKEAGKKLGYDSAAQQMPRIGSDPSTTEDNAHQPASLAMQQQTPADAGTYLNQFVLPRVDNPPVNQPRPEMAAVGGPPGAGTANICVNSGKFAKAAKAVVEGGAVGSTEIDGMGLMAADLLGGVFVQGLEALVGAGLGPEFAGKGGPFAKAGFDVKSLVSAIEGAAGGDRNGSAGARVRGNVISLEEAERALQAARKEHDVLEKKLGVLMKKNRKVFVGAAGGKA